MPYSKGISPFNQPNFDLFSPARLEDPRGVVLGAPLDGGSSYVPWIGLTTVRELALQHADKVGLVERADLDVQIARTNALRDQNERLRARVEQLEEQQERIAGLVRDGFKVQKIMGRPKGS